jgi:hypothetical protein
MSIILVDFVILAIGFVGTALTVLGQKSLK